MGVFNGPCKTRQKGAYRVQNAVKYEQFEKFISNNINELHAFMDSLHRHHVEKSLPPSDNENRYPAGCPDDSLRCSRVE